MPERNASRRATWGAGGPARHVSPPSERPPVSTFPWRRRASLTLLLALSVVPWAAGPAGLVQFLSYEGTFAGVGGPADGVTSTDIARAEGSTTADGSSLQLSGSGTTYQQFTWQAAAAPT